jgi:dynein heavy chain 1
MTDLLATAIGDLIVPAEEISALRTFVKQSCMVYLDMDEKLENEIDNEKYVDYFKSFINNPEKNCFLVVQSPQVVKLMFALEDLPTNGQGLVISKRKRVIYQPPEPTKYSRMLNVLYLGQLDTEFNPFDITQVSIQNTFLPLLNSVKPGNKEKEAEETKNLNNIKKKLSELQLMLIRNNKMLELSDVTFNYNPKLKELIAEAKLSGKELKPEDLPKEIIEDNQLINSLADNVNEFKDKVQEFMQIINNKQFDSVLEEMQFYELYFEKLTNLKRIIDSEDMKTILALLKFKKKFGPTMDFESELNFTNNYTAVADVTTNFKQIPINELLTVNTVDNLHKVITDLSNEVSAFIRKTRGYQVNSIPNLYKALNKDIYNQIIKIWKGERILDMPNENYRQMIFSTKSMFTQVDKFFSDTKKDMSTKYRALSRDLIENMGSDIATLKARFKKIESVKDRAITLMSNIDEVKKLEQQYKEDKSLFSQIDVSQVKTFSKPLENIDLLNMTKDGEDQLTQASEANRKLHEDFENKIIEKITEKLGLAQNEEELYRVYTVYLPFLSKSSGQSSSIKFKDNLTKALDAKFEDLKEKYRNKYSISNSRYISEFYDIPVMTGGFIWNQQILGKMKETLDRSTKISGEVSAQNQKIKQTQVHFNEFRDNNKNEEAKSIASFTSDFKQQKDEIYSQSIFAVREKWGSNNEYELCTNFDDKFIEKVKNMRNIAGRPDGVDFTTSYQFIKTDWLVFRSASYLKETLSLLNYLTSKLDEKTEKLLAYHLKDIQEYIKQNFNQKWSDGTRILDGIIETLAIKVNNLESSYNYIIQRREQIDRILTFLESCEIDSQVFTEKIKEIQTILDELYFKSYSNIHTLVNDLEISVERVLKKRLTDIIGQWCIEFENYKNRDIERKLIKENTVHEIKVQNQVIFVEPPIEYANAFWLAHFHACVGIICNLPKLDPSSFSEANAVAEKKGTHQMYYHHLLHEIDGAVLNDAYARINKVISEADKYARTWLSYQGLWELEFADVQQHLKDDINSWQMILNDIKSGRSIFDNSETELFFGAIRVNYRTVQVKITSKYDQWHKEILNQFGKTLNTNLNKFFAVIKQARQKLEKIDFSTSEGTVTAISDLNYCKKGFPKWSQELEHFKDGQKLLELQRFHFPSDWTFSDQIEGDWLVVKQILAKKTDDFDKMFDELKAKLDAEEVSIRSKMEDINKIWEEKKPYEGDMSIKEALDVLNIVDTKLADVQKRYTEMNKAKELMELIPADTSAYESKKEEVEGLKEVWNEISKVWKKIDAMADTTLPASQPAKMVKELDAVVEEMNSLPNKFRSYEAFTKKRDIIKALRKMTLTINNLKAETFKERHWKELLKKINIKKSQNDLTIGELWRLDLNKYHKIIDALLEQAGGEFVLEDMLRKIKEYWQNFELDLVRYQNKCKLIRGWDELFAKVEEDLGSLASMKLSPHFKSFEEEINPWNERIQKISIIFNSWIDVQRKWVYLEGIFMGSGEIKTQLANEFNKFKGIDNEFVTLMKKVATKPKMLEVITTPNLQKTLERLSDSLDKIQKALTDYLETQRQAFARFYFVGDEDLLEIIGNSKDVINIQKHFPKMFAGISTITNENNGDVLKGMCSKEDERVAFVKNVVISENPKIDAWLKAMENQMKISLGYELEKATKGVSGVTDISTREKFEVLREIIKAHPTQAVMLSFQILWTELIEDCLEKGQKVAPVVDRVVTFLGYLAEEVLSDLEKSLRQKYEQLITESVHQRDVARILNDEGVTTNKDFRWQYYMRFYFNPKEQDILNKLVIKMGNAQFHYGFEYLGVSEKLVQTPLTDKCYLTLTQALSLRMGGAPFGPAGTGKTESVKMLGSQLGNFVLVFNCDETFNFKAMGRIFIGLCQVGAWGCFDEFNRLEERILSAVSQQILTIQTGLREKSPKIELMGREVKLNPDMGIFVTMNPGYAGRSNLPENLKQLFRQMAMVTPDKELIGQVMLFSQGFKSAEKLAGKIVSLFELCNNQLSSQPHYDFGLRALKAVLNSAGSLKRSQTKAEDMPLEIFEQNILLRSLCDTVVPKLVAEDIPLLSNLLLGVFPGAEIPKIRDEKLFEALKIECQRRFLLPTDKFIEKVMQLNAILKLQHGVMVVGPSGCGKSAAWKALLDAMTRVDGIKGDSYIIDPKSINKDDLYGKLDNTTLDWSDGIFTHVLRKIVENQRGESTRRHWIVFDGDVDPEWAENLNSVLDDNKLLTLPNGERIAIPPNVRILFEVENLKYATLATVSRCGMVWFSDDIVHPSNIFHHYLERLKQEDFDTKALEIDGANEAKEKLVKDQYFSLREKCVEFIKPLFEGDNSFGLTALAKAEVQKHVMVFTKIRVLEAAFALIRKGISKIIEYNESHPDFPLEEPIMEKFMTKWAVLSVNWGFVGDLKLHLRTAYWQDLVSSVTLNIELPPIGENLTLIDYEVTVEKGEWSLWKSKVPYLDLEPEKVSDADLIITTVDTLRHQEVLCAWLSEHRPFLICGPPGSGKTMTLMSTLKNLPDFEMIFINFSSSTTPALIQKQFDHYCEYTKTHQGIILRPKMINKWLVVFCDEINLPDEDKYGTQAVITFLRQLTEQQGFYRSSDKAWVHLERIQFVGACNPPTDVGRHPLSLRFLRHVPLILVDFPGYESLMQIYGTFNRAMLKKAPTVKSHADALTEAMVEYYTRSQKRFTSDMQAHYIYSPRELTRWKYAINEALDTFETVEDLIRLWANEALRLFQDRLVYDDEKEWCEKQVDEIAHQCFRNFRETALQRPILFSAYLTKDYRSVEQEKLREYVIAKLKTFNEEEYDIQLVVFDSVLDHIVRIDRVLRQPIGHLLLVGASGVGKTTLSRFVSWMNNLTVFQIKAGRNYALADFDADLRDVMKRAGCKQEKITFIFDESNVLSVAFLERMNALLASGEVPGLFEGDEYITLISACKEGFGGGKVMETEEEIYKKFVKNVQRNLHVVFTMNPANPDFSNRAGSSPAIFNRCVIDWFGDWPNEALYQVAKELTHKVEFPESSFDVKGKDEASRRGIMTEIIVYIHNSVRELNRKLQKGAKKFNYITPRDYLDFINHFIRIQKEKKAELEEQQFHINTGLNKLKETEDEVFKLKESLNVYKKELKEKEIESEKKLALMMNEQTVAEKQKASSIELNEKLQVKQGEIKKRSVVVQSQLDEAGPALEKAQSEVQNINPTQLREVQSLAKPPDNIRVAMTAVIMLLTQGKVKKVYEWKEIQAAMKERDFIERVLSLKIDNVPHENIAAVRNFIETNDWVVDKFYKASKAVGPLAAWVDSQIKFSEIVLKVEPLRKEVAELEQEEKKLVEQKKGLEAQIETLEKNIQNYKVEYGELVSKKESIKGEMEKVESKVIRSTNLLENLSTEKVRWDASSKGFSEQMKTMTGDSLLAAAFLTYIGFFDQFYRKLLIEHWKNYFIQMNLVYRHEVSLIEFLSKASDRMNWQSHKLPADDLCSENAIILSRFNRYPLIIDPAGQAMDFILSYYADKKIVRTSFADEAFMKHLETSLRFGCPILVQDVEKIDPILNSVLNKEVHKQGGRTLIRVGDHEIDFNDNFRLFMITRDANARFTPDVCSRVTFVNFTVTPASLQNQCLMIFLKHERPEVEAKRLNLLKLQGEFIVRLRELEDDLLNKLSNIKGNILDNEEMIKTLEVLKNEAKKVMEDMSKSDQVLKEVESVTAEYIELAEVSSKIYFSLQAMGQIYSFYQFSLNYFMSILMKVLEADPELDKIPKTDYSQRIKVATKQMFIRNYHKTYYSLLNKDKMCFCLKLVQIKLGARFENLFQCLIRPSTLVVTNLNPKLIGGSLKDVQLKALEEVSTLPGFENLISHLERKSEEWKQFATTEEYSNIPTGWENEEYINSFKGDLQSTARDLMHLVVTNIIRPDFMIFNFNHFIVKVMGQEFADVPVLDLAVAMEDSHAKSPLLLSCAPGFDASFKVDQLARHLNKKYTAIAIGSAEGFELANKSIDQAIQSGSWVLLKNVHLAPDYLIEIEQKIFRATPNPNFRLFLTMEFSDRIPNTLLRQSLKFIFELPDGVKSSIKRIYGTVFTSERSDVEPIERSRLHFLLGWLHAVILERMRYKPIGWSKGYEFNEADLRCALDLVDEYIDIQGKKHNLPIDKIPWEAIRSVLINNIYGGKIDNDYDSKILKSLVEQFFSPDSFDINKSMVPELHDPNLKVPEASKYQEFKEWVEKLPENESPIWSGLPHNAEKVLKEQKNFYTLHTLWKIQDINDENITDIAPDTKRKNDSSTNEQGGSTVKWLAELNQRVGRYLDLLPMNVQKLVRTQNSLSNPLFRFLEREVNVVSSLLDTVRTNLGDVKAMCEGKIQPLMELKTLAHTIYSGQIPKGWKRFTFWESIDVTAWISDLKKRLEQFDKLISTSDWQKKGVWLGGLLFPEAFMTATRQYVAQNTKSSLDELELKAVVHDGGAVDDNSFLVDGLVIQGGAWTGASLSMSKELTNTVKTIKCTWIKINPADKYKLNDDQIFVPVYLNQTRKNLLFSIKLNCANIPRNNFYQRGIALIAWHE